MSQERVLVIEDEETIQELIRYNLTKEGYQVVLADTGEEGLRQARARIPEMILLDLMLPGIDGLEVFRLLRSDDRTRGIPVIILTAKGEDVDVVAGLELGAEDYITKPFSPRILLARMRGVLRRHNRPPEEETGPIQLFELIIHPGRHEVSYRGKPIRLTHTEFRILHLLARRSGWVFSRQQIVDQVHGEDYPVTERSVDVQIAGLRKKLGDAAELVETVRGVGYRFKDRPE